MSETVPLEAVAFIKTQEMISSHVGMQAFVATLTDEQRRRFAELAPHIYHDGVEDGITRQAIEMSADRKAAFLVHETRLFMLGAATYKDELG